MIVMPNSPLLTFPFFNASETAGHPILFAIAAASFVLFYTIDKWSILRVYGKPAMYDETLTRFVARILPWAGLCHLAVACWMCA